jgi:hypothetical protein
MEKAKCRLREKSAEISTQWLQVVQSLGQICDFN